MNFVLNEEPRGTDPPPGGVPTLLCFNYSSRNYTVSTEYSSSSMEFQTENGTQIPISRLDDSQAITVSVANNSWVDGSPAPERLLAEATNVSHCSSVIVKVSAGNTNRHAGLHIQLSFSPLDDRAEETEADPSIDAYLHDSAWPNEYNCSQKKHISLSMLSGLDHKPFTFFVSPQSHDTTLDYYVNTVDGRLEVGVFSSLCQYFNESEREWRTDGMVPSAETTAERAVCVTQHLTSFAASLFVPPESVQFIVPKRSSGLSLVVLLTCVVGLVCYAVAAAILHKLDQLDLRRAAVVPLCGKDGLFKYEVQVKTGWARGAGTTAHVGISLYGRESRSGHRHLDSSEAFARNSLDIFQIATDTSLGSVWKIRIWHDNKGLSPAWRLQYVLVKDLQTGSSYYFLVEEWLSVDNEKTDGRVEIEVEASAEGDIRRLPRLLSWELQRSVSESHIWLSLWDRPPRSPFTRLQRATCCAVLLHLSLLANAVWYATVVDGARSPVAVSRLAAVSGETLAVGLVSCTVVYPLYLLLLLLFRMARSKVSVEQLPPQVDQESLEIDDFLDSSLNGGSFLIFNSVPGETCSEETNVDLPTPSTKSSLQRWGVADRERVGNWPDLLSDPAVVGGALPRLKRGQGSRHLGVDMALSPEEEEAGGYAHRNKYFTSSDEDLIKRILADGQLQVSRLCDPQQFFSQTDSEMADLSSIFGDKTEVILLQKLNEPLPPGVVRREPPKTAFTSRTVMADVCRQRRFPAWCGQAALVGSWAVLALTSGLAVWLGLSFSERVALMWLISVISSFLASFCLLEPLKVLLEGLYFALVVRRLRPEEQDVLVESPRVEHVSQRIPRVRPPQGFALFQAREEARKVHLLHSMLKNFLLYMLFLLVVLLMCCADSSRDAHSLQLHSQLRHRLMPGFSRITRREEVWAWLSRSLLPLLLDSQVLMRETGCLLLVGPRLRQIRGSHGFSWVGSGQFGSVLRNRTLGLGWTGLESNRTQNWTAQLADAPGAWHWGQTSIYGSGGYIQDLHRSVGASEAVIRNLERHHWLDSLTRAVFVEFSLYNTNTDLLAVLTFLLEYPSPQGALWSLDLKTCFLHRLSAGLDLLLLLTVFLLVLVLCFLVRGVLSVRRDGCGHFLRPWSVAGACSLVLSLCAAALHLSRSSLADSLWEALLSRPHAFTDFYPLALLSRAFSQITALLLFLLVLRAAQQLRFLREWAVFGRALRRSAWELLAAASVLLVLLLAYAHAGHLLFHSVLDGYGSVSSALMTLLGAGRGLLSWRPAGPACSGSCLAYHGSFSLLQLWLLWLVTSALLRNYRLARAELYRPAIESQDYEMVELFLRRLKMWMGLSRAKEFRHKVRFEGMELPPSRSSSTSDCKSLCLPPLDTPEAPPTPDSVDAWRPASSSPCIMGAEPGLVPVGGASWRERAEAEATLRRLLPAFDSLLLQLDRTTQAAEDVYRVECRLERAQRRRNRKRSQRDSAGRRHHSGKGRHRTRPRPEATPQSNPAPASVPDPTPTSTPAPDPAPRRREWDGPVEAADPIPSSLFRHPAHTTTIPTRKKRKPPPMKNKVHPNTDVHVSGHPKP
ncbi:hypothetical protein GJAV_G00265340 [Gymnothorax javanicus]|nr:hypothetical protein GJAV_G00265340 [Gymnothorax javanicus]